MKISTRGRYGLRAMVDIAVHSKDNCITLKSISLRQGISENYLEQIISPIKKAGFVESTRGSQGGYKLSRQPKEISVGDILNVLEGSLYAVNCDSDNEADKCNQGSCSNCATRPVWEKIYNSLNEVLQSMTLQDLVNDYNNMC